MRRKLFYLTAPLMVLLMLLVGCDKDSLVEEPPNIITNDMLFADYSGFQIGLNGLYGNLKYEFMNNNSFSNFYAIGTDVQCTNPGSYFGYITSLWGTSNEPSYYEYREDFTWLYSIINGANTIINLAEERDDINWIGGSKSEADNKNSVIAEAKALRAWAYRHLTYLWGDVPLVTVASSGSAIKTDWERAPVSSVRKLIVSDLLFAENYVGIEPSVRGRITKGAIQTYLAEMYLVLDKPDSALYWSDKVVSNPAYALKTERYGTQKNNPGVAFMDMFWEGNSDREEGNTEGLWVWQYLYGVVGDINCQRRYETVQRYWSIPVGSVVPLQLTVARGGRGQGWTALTKYAIDNYEPQDDRGSHFAIQKFFILTDAAGNGPIQTSADKLPAGYNYGDTIWLDWSRDITTGDVQRYNWPFTRKWIGGNSPASVADGGNYNDHILLRSAEAYLLKAEAQYLLGSSEDAANTINIIRRRSHASDITAQDVNIDFILDERARELLVEENRRYTLLRTGKWLERVKKYNHKGGEFATERDELFPIPQAVIDANLTKKMPQNPGFN